MQSEAPKTPPGRRREGGIFVAILPGLACVLTAGPAAGVAPEAEARPLPPIRMVGQDIHGGTDATISPDGRYIVVSSRRSGNLDLWMLDTKFGRWRQLTSDPADDIEPQWSPDGRNIAYTSTRSGNKDIWWLKLENLESRQLTDSAHDDEYPSWAHDSRRIVFTTGAWKQRHFMVATIASSPDEEIPARRVNRDAGHVGACSFHPDGESLVCHDYETGFGDIVHLSLDGSLIRKITDGQSWDYKPSVSADGSLVSFTRIAGGSSAIWVKRIDGEIEYPVTSSLSNDRWPFFYRHRDRDYIFFHRLVHRGSSISVYDRQTGRTTQIVESAERPLQAAFDSRADRVAYCADAGSKQEIRILRRSTGERSTLPLPAENACYPRWSPDDSAIAYLGSSGGTWHLSVYEMDGGEARTLTQDADFPNGILGPIDWSPGGDRLVFAANVAPYESNLFMIDAAGGDVEYVTDDDWYDESPSLDADGNVLFMSTRGGGWTWGLFRASPASGEAPVAITRPDYVEKNFLRPGPGGELTWSEYRMCDATHFVALQQRGQAPRLLRELPGAQWPSFSKDGSEILVTQVQNHVEFWRVAIDEFRVGARLRSRRAHPGRATR